MTTRISPSLSLTRLAFVIGSLAAALSSGCGIPGGNSATPARSDTKLVGGQAMPPNASTSYLTSTVQIWGNCTAAKIGPKLFLTAAHCMIKAPYNVFDPVIDSYKIGAKVFVTNDKNPAVSANPGWQQLTITFADLHPLYLAECLGRAVCDQAAINLFAKNGPDVAAFRVAEATPGIPVAGVNLDPLSPADSVTLTGYGCETGLTANTSFAARFKSQGSYVVDEQALNGDVNVGAAERPNVAFWNLLTPGHGYASDQASLCPGDSGGPLYDAQTRVVAVNAYYSFSNPAQIDVSTANWHTKLSNDGVKTWLQAELATQ